MFPCTMYSTYIFFSMRKFLTSIYMKKNSEKPFLPLIALYLIANLIFCLLFPPATDKHVTYDYSICSRSGGALFGKLGTQSYIDDIGQSQVTSPIFTFSA